MRYLDQATIDDARNAHGFGVPLDHIAGHLQITVDELRVALGLPQWKREPQDRQRELPFDLFRVEELDGQL